MYRESLGGEEMIENSLAYQNPSGLSINEDDQTFQDFMNPRDIIDSPLFFKNMISANKCHFCNENLQPLFDKLENQESLNNNMQLTLSHMEKKGTSFVKQCQKLSSENNKLGKQLDYL